MDGQNAIRTQDLCKQYGECQAVVNVNLEVLQGEIFSLLGPNGAGKSTMISMLSGLLKPTRGEAWVMGHSIHREATQVRRVIGVVPQDIALYPDLSARENLLFWGRMYGLGGKELQMRSDEILNIIGLEKRQNGKVASFSGGMKRRVNIGIALLHKPQVLILDEPTVGIDPQSRRHILDNVKGLNQQGMTVLYTSHYMEEAQELSHHIAIMDQGKVIAFGKHEDLVKLVGEMDRVRLSINTDPDCVMKDWERIDGVQGLVVENGNLSLLVEDSNLVLPRLFESGSRLGVRINSVEVHEPNLEAVFLHLTGRGLRD